MSSQYFVYFEIINLIHEGLLISLTYTSDSPTFQFTLGKRPAWPSKAFRSGIISHHETLRLGIVLIIREV